MSQSRVNIFRQVFSHFAGVTAPLWSLALGLAFWVGMMPALEAAPGDHPFKHLQREFQRRQQGDAVSGEEFKWIIVGLIALAAALLIASWITNSLRNPRPYFSRWLLLFELCWIHRLKWRDMWRIWQWARQARIHPPARLFIDPDLWPDRQPARSAAGNTAVARPPDAACWQDLCRRVFGPILDAVPAADEVEKAQPVAQQNTLAHGLETSSD